MFTRSMPGSIKARQVSKLVSLALCYLASAQLPAFSAPDFNVGAAAASTAPSSMILKEAVTRNMVAKPKRSADNIKAAKTDHLYYLVYTAPGQIARGDFGARKIFITAEPGAIVATDGLKVKVISGQVDFDNEGSSNLTILFGGDVVDLQPGQQKTVGRGLNIGGANSTVVNPIVENTIIGSTEKKSHKHSKNIASEPVRLWAEENCQFGVTQSGIIELLKGQIIISASQATQVHTLAGTVDCDPFSIVSVRCSEAGLAVENASYYKPANVHSHGHTILVDGGRSVVLLAGAPDSTNVPVDGVERRQLYASFDGYMTVLKSEFKMTSLIKRYKSLRLAMNSPISPYEKNLVNHWVKDMAVYSTMHGEPEDFSEKPEILAVTRLGQFFNPYFAN